MLRIIFYWFIATFIYYKASFPVVFGYGSGSSSGEISIMASLLLAVMVAISIFHSTHHYLIKQELALGAVASGQEQTFVKDSLRILSIFLTTNLILGKIIIYGFSKELNRIISGKSLLFKGGYYAYEGFLFFIIVLAPLLLHYAMTAYTVHVQMQTIKKNKGVPEDKSIFYIFSTDFICKIFSTDLMLSSIIIFLLVLMYANS